MTSKLLISLSRLVLVAALAAPVAVASAGQAAAATSPERRMLQMVNAAREKQGLSALEMSRRLSRRAERNSRTMARHRKLSHSGNLRSGMAENVGVGTTLRLIMRAWMASPEHRDNILGKYRIAGLGVDKSAGFFWVTLVLR